MNARPDVREPAVLQRSASNRGSEGRGLSISTYGPPAAALLLLLIIVAALVWWLPVSEAPPRVPDAALAPATERLGDGSAFAGTSEDPTPEGNGTGGDQSPNAETTYAAVASAETQPGADHAPTAESPSDQPAASPRVEPDPRPVQPLGFVSDLNAPPAPTPTPDPGAGSDTLSRGGNPGLASFFGAPGRGSRFVYIIDRSGSMNGDRFQSARFELIKSIRALQPHEMFYVIFYDKHALPMPGTQMVPATEPNKQKAIAWVRSAGTGGGTDPTEALAIALRDLRPDTIWLLSDGAFDVAVTDTVRTMNPGPRVQINTIAFHNRGGETVLKILADENDGDFRFVGPP